MSGTTGRLNAPFVPVVPITENEPADCQNKKMPGMPWFVLAESTIFPASVVVAGISVRFVVTVAFVPNVIKGAVPRLKTYPDRPAII